MESIVLIIVLLYFLPTMIAFFRGHSQRVSICLVNVVLGWTFLGWFVSLVWAASTDTKKAIEEALIQMKMREMTADEKSEKERLEKELADTKRELEKAKGGKNEILV